MLDFAIFAVTIVVALIGLVVYLYPGRSKPTTVPGLEPTDPSKGNLADIAAAGSLHEFLIFLHDKYGSIASFWMGNQLVISIAKVDLFQQQMGLFDRPPSLFKLFEPLIGPMSIEFANKADGRMRRNTYDKCYSHSVIKCLYPIFNEFANELADKWGNLVGEEHIPVKNYMFSFAIKSITLASFGDYFKDEKKVQKLKMAKDFVWTEMERRLTSTSQDAETQKRFEENKKILLDICDELLKHRRKNPPLGDEYLLIDTFLEADMSDEQLRSDAITYLIGGFHTTGNLLSWAIYFLASHPDAQEKLYEEIKAVLGDDDVDSENASALIYLRQVIDETMRCAVLAPYAARYDPDSETELGGHVIPPGTPVIQAVGVTFQDEEVWPNPNKFDPDRFSSENVKSRHRLSFSPFGFAGKRKCPGYRFAYAEATTALAILFSRFKIKLVDDQVVLPLYQLVTTSADEIWIQVEERKKK
ncbi:cytochrome P450 20A1-like [Lineus longissimus]|uniref:cytochrome P450 20A1-like n=1 Tax=Lineus longissimus TaxID=88925 RepID=UPI00315D72F3